MNKNQLLKLIELAVILQNAGQLPASQTVGNVFENIELAVIKLKEILNKQVEED